MYMVQEWLVFCEKCMTDYIIVTSSLPNWGSQFPLKVLSDFYGVFGGHFVCLAVNFLGEEGAVRTSQLVFWVALEQA